ncbi:MAG TPA: fatty acid desaturase [Cytophagales bacterium]|nr:fatty acid desaturase [Cytophagales bacterium]
MQLDHSALFAKALNDRLNAYFHDNSISTKGNFLMIVKIITALLWWVISYLLIFVMSTSPLEFIALYLLHGLSHVYLAFNVGHDAVHGSISTSKFINTCLSYSFDILGINSYMWKRTHHAGHHACLNVPQEDISLQTAGIIRLSNGEPIKKVHIFQHGYVFIIYALYLFYYVFVKDFECFLSNSKKHWKPTSPPMIEWIKLIVAKAFYLLYMLAIPIYLLPFETHVVIAAFCITLTIIGLIVSFTFQTTHIIDTTYYPKSRIEYENYIFHVFATTADYATSNPLAHWFLGGLNTHVIHHLRADICHTHYPALTSIVKATAAEFGIHYRQNRTFLSAIKAHLRQLKILGKE